MTSPSDEISTSPIAAANYLHDTYYDNQSVTDSDVRRADSHTEIKPVPETTGSNDVTAANVEEHKDFERTGTHRASTSEQARPAGSVGTLYQVQSVHAIGPSQHMNPTSVRVHLKGHAGGHGHTGQKPQTTRDVYIQWRSRDNRKNRNLSVVSAVPTSARGGRPIIRYGFALRDVGKNLLRMCTTFPYWDMAFWSGWSYTIGSILFVIDGAWSWSPLAFPSDEFSGEEYWGVPFLFFFGALFFELGAAMAYFEAINDGSFHGAAMRRFLDGREQDSKALLDEKLRQFFGHVLFFRKSRDLTAKHPAHDAQVDPEAGWRAKDTVTPTSSNATNTNPALRRGALNQGVQEKGHVIQYTEWRWWPTWHAFRTYHIYEIGYISCAIQLFGATLYGMTGIIILPGILDTLKEWQVNACYWIPQMVASACFLTASIGFTLEPQDKWYKPNFGLVAWWIGAWAIVGSVGFELCAAFGPPSFKDTWSAYQSDLSSMWGSAAYLISSALQWYEAVNKHPVEDLFETLEMAAGILQPIHEDGPMPEEKSTSTAEPNSRGDRSV